MRATVFDRIEDAGAGWDALAPAEFHFSRPFLQVMRDARVEDARYRYVVLEDGGAPVALTVLTRFRFRIDCLSRDPWTRLLRRSLPGLLDVPVVCCGIPASFGQHHLHLLRPSLADEVVRRVHACMEEWAREERCAMLFFKEWNPGHPVHSALRRAGYLPLPTLPDHRVSCGDSGVERFLGSLRSPYRRRYREAAALMSGPGPHWQRGPLRLERLAFGPAHVADFHRGYLCVMERATMRLETYPLAFFERLAGSPLAAFLLRLRRADTEERLEALMIPSGDVLTFALIAKERARYGASLYRMLLQCMVLHALDAGYRELRLGQTSDYAKCSVGATPVRLETLVRVRSEWKHRLVARVSARLFPERASPRLSVFRSDELPQPVTAPGAGRPPLVAC